MTVVGLNFTKMLAEKTKPVKGGINIKNNVSFNSVEEAKLSIDPKKNALKVGFKYTSTYDPEIGKIVIDGEVVYLAEEKAAKDVLASWKKDKKIPTDVAKNLMNHILMKCNVQAVVLSKDINLPAPIPMPKMK